MRKLKLADVTPFPYGFEGNIKAPMADIGRTLGSRTNPARYHFRNSWRNPNG